MGTIHKVLVANRGEIARRIFRTCHSLGIATVAVFSDADASLPHCREADEAVRIGEPPSASSYLNIEAIIDAARSTGADAVHPGYGFLSENARFAEAVLEAGLTWIGPPPPVIASLGDKAEARRSAKALGVPIVPGFDEEGATDAQLEAAASEVGFPLMIKAVAGGGGRGMRRVDDLGEFADALASARREALSSFGDDAVLLERYVEQPRHVEVQVFGDTHGNVIHLGERDCSVQRRHQKVVEEAPSPAVDEALRSRLGSAAVRVAAAAGYVGAGTVEFLLAPDGSFYFLEMNARLQVEHPVTELVTGQDLVAWQIAVAEGEPLPLSQDEVKLRGHAIEVRVYAEDPSRDYMPSAGTLMRAYLPDPAGGRVDAGYEDGDTVSVHYDAMLAKVIAWGSDRQRANRSLGRALQAAWLPGVATNLPMLRHITRDPDWVSGQVDTSYLAGSAATAAPPSNLQEGALVSSVLAWWRRQRQGTLSGVTQGWRMHGVAEETDTWAYLDEEITVATRDLGDSVEVTVGDADPVICHVLDVTGDVMRLRRGPHITSIRLATDGPDQRIVDGTTVYAHLGHGESMVRLVPRFSAPAGLDAEPGSCVAPTPAVVRAVHVAREQQVAQGDALVTLEAMKMEHVIRAPFDGTVASVLVDCDQSVQQGALLVRLEPLDA